MLRVVLVNALLFLLPFLIWSAYRLLNQPEQPVGGTPRSLWDDAPVGWLAIAGAALSLGVLLFFATLQDGKPGGVYRPPEFKGGKIEPGEIK